jgi:hypothetical protein
MGEPRLQAVGALGLAFPGMGSRMAVQ